MKYVIALFLMLCTFNTSASEVFPSEVLLDTFKQKCFNNKDKVPTIPLLLIAEDYQPIATELRQSIVGSNDETHGQSWGYSKNQIMIVGNDYLCQVVSTGQIGDIWYITGNVANTLPVIRGTSLVSPRISYHPYQLKDEPLGWVIVMDGPLVGISLVYHLEEIEE